jgi:hypothetical protein
VIDGQRAVGFAVREYTMHKRINYASHRYPPADYKRLWNTSAMEFVVRSDTLAVRRREPNRLQKKYERARDGQPASVQKNGSAGKRNSAGKRKAIPINMVKAKVNP